jgi:triosephosphate isomerase
MRKLLVGGNWKQNGTLKFAQEFSQNVLNRAKFDANKVEVVVSPSTLHLVTAKQALQSHIQVSA